MSRLATFGRTLALLVVLLLGTSPLRAFSWFTWDGYVVVWSQAASTRFLMPSTFPPGSDTEMLYLGAMGLWVIVPSANFDYTYATWDQDYPIDHYDGYSDTAAVDPASLDPGVLGVTYMVNNGAAWFDMDMVFSADAAGYDWDFSTNPDCVAVSNPALGGMSFLLVSTHELGHALGLGHEPLDGAAPGTPWFIATMNASYPAGGPIGEERIVELHADDRNAVRFLYPNSGPTDPVTDIANSGYTTGTTVGKAVPAFFTPVSVYPGELVTLRSVIENFGNQNVAGVRQGFYLSTDDVIDTSDTYLGALYWDIPYGDGFDFDVDANMPTDIAAGTYYLGSILDDLEQVTEEYEDNNIHVYCDTLTIAQLPPTMGLLGQDTAACGQSYSGPVPTVSHPLNMAPLTWSLDNPQPGMTIDAATGVVSWPNPIYSGFPYALIVRATNDAGTDAEYLFLNVTHAAPALVPIEDETIALGAGYVGPTPTLSDPNCMQPIVNWSLDAAPAGMTIDHGTGVVSWPLPTCAALGHEITVRATNGVGNGTVTWRLYVASIVGDLDCDADVDGDDVTLLLDCLHGPDVWSPPTGCGPEPFARADLDDEGDVDLADVGALQVAR